METNQLKWAVMPYLDGELDPQEVKEFEAALLLDLELQKEVEELKNINAMVKKSVDRFQEGEVLKRDMLGFGDEVMARLAAEKEGASESDAPKGQEGGGLLLQFLDVFHLREPWALATAAIAIFAVGAYFVVNSTDSAGLMEDSGAISLVDKGVETEVANVEVAKEEVVEEAVAAVRETSTLRRGIEVGGGLAKAELGRPSIQAKPAPSRSPSLLGAQEANGERLAERRSAESELNSQERADVMVEHLEASRGKAFIAIDEDDPEAPMVLWHIVDGEDISAPKKL